jgi:hypothetical protein
MENNVDIKALKQITDAIFDHIINDLDVKSVSIEATKDFYWEPPMDKLYSVKENQPQLDIGRLSDDWQFLKPIIEDTDQAVALMLTHVAPLLRYIGQKIGK